MTIVRTPFTRRRKPTTDAYAAARKILSDEGVAGPVIFHARNLETGREEVIESSPRKPLKRVPIKRIDYARAARLYAEGLSQLAVAEILGCHASALSRHFHKVGIPITPTWEIRGKVDLDNDWTALASRRLVELYPDLSGLFAMRARQS
jgi:AraC-like DNA-binding protein